MMRDLEDAKQELLMAQKQQGEVLGAISQIAEERTGKLAEEQQKKLDQQQTMLREEQEKLQQLLEAHRNERLERAEREKAERELKEQRAKVERLLKEERARAAREEKLARARKKREEKLHRAEEKERQKRAKREAAEKARLEREQLKQKSIADAELGGGVVNVKGVKINTKIKDTLSVSLKDFIGLADSQYRCCLMEGYHASYLKLGLIDVRVFLKELFLRNRIELGDIRQRLACRHLVFDFFFTAGAELFHHFLFRQDVFQIGVAPPDIHILYENGFFHLNAFASAAVPVLDILQHLGCGVLILHRSDFFAVNVDTVSLDIEISHIGQSLEHVFGAVYLSISKSRYPLELYIVHDHVHVFIFCESALDQIRYPEDVILFLDKSQSLSVIRIGVGRIVIEYAGDAYQQHYENRKGCEQ